MAEQVGHWQIDRKIPITFIVVVIIQTFSVGFWGARTEDKIADHERRMSLAEIELARHDQDMSIIGERLARLEEKSTAQLSIAQHLEQILETRNSHDPSYSLSRR